MSIVVTGLQLLPAGTMLAYGGRTAPSGYLFCDSTAVSRTTYLDLFNAIVPSLGTFTVTIASPGVITLSGHGFITGDSFYATTTGALPTGFTANTLYYVIYLSSSTFQFATSIANAYAGTAVNTSGTQSGTHTLYACPYGLGNGSTTFNVPDVRGRTLAGADAMGGTSANRLTGAKTTGSYGNLGASGGNQVHQLTTAELASHAHGAAAGSFVYSVGVGGGAALTGGSTMTTGANTASAGSDGTHNNVQPTAVSNVIIKT